MTSSETILSILDTCCDAFEFPMLDNGYTYLAATRLTLFRGGADWGLVIEVFGYSVRAGLPDTYLHVFGSDVQGRPGPERYVTRAAWETAMEQAPFHWHRGIHPIEDGDWISEEGQVTPGTSVQLRGQTVPLPADGTAYASAGVALEDPPHVEVHEACRWLAATHRAAVLATEAELAACFGAHMQPILQLDGWHHPDVVDDAHRPSNSESFRMLASVLETGDVSMYAPTEAPNTHWSNWPDGGTL